MAFFLGREAGAKGAVQPTERLLEERLIVILPTSLKELRMFDTEY